MKTTVSDTWERSVPENREGAAEQRPAADGDDLNELAIGGSGENTIFESYADDTFTPIWESAFYIPGNVMAMSVGPDNEFGYPTIASCSFDGQVDIIGYDGSTYVRQLNPPLNLGNALRSVDLGYFDGGDPALDLVLARSGINLVSLFEEESLSGVEWEATGGSEYRLEVAGTPF